MLKPPSNFNVRIVKRDHFIETACNDLLDCYHTSLAKRGTFRLALSGGSTPLPIYKRLLSSDLHGCIDWSKVQLFWCDERCVSIDDPQSNYGAAMRLGFAQTAATAYPIYSESKEISENGCSQSAHSSCLQTQLQEHAQAYDTLLKAMQHPGKMHSGEMHSGEMQPGEMHSGKPIIDYAILGMGSDGHCASLFPDGRLSREEASTEISPDQITSHLIERIQHLSIEQTQSVDSVEIWKDPCTLYTREKPLNTNQNHSESSRRESSETQPLCCAYWVPSQGAWRLSMTLNMLNSCERKVFYLQGDCKAQTLHEVLETPQWPRFPAAHVEGALWLCDEAAASKLKRSY